MSKTLVIIVTYNAMKWADRCLGSALASVTASDVFVVDNASIDGTADYIEEHFPGVILRRMEHNIGFGQANNIGLRYALAKGYEYVYLLNQDAWIEPDTIGKLVAVSSHNPDYGVLSPFQMSADGRHIDKAFTYNVCSWHSNRELFEDMYAGRLAEAYTVTNVMAAHWLMTRRCIEKVGGFSPTFFQYGEDDNYVDRVRFHGLQAGIVPGATAVHDRAERVRSKKEMIQLLAIQHSRAISAPGSKGPAVWLSAFFNLFIKAPWLYHSLYPQKLFLEMAGRTGTILRNRKLSTAEGPAFL